MTITKRKMPTLLGASIFPLAAAAALYAMPRGTQYKQQLLAVYFILQVFQCITAIIFSWAFANTAGHTKKTTTTGMLYVGLTVGNIVGPREFPGFSPSFSVLLPCSMPRDPKNIEPSQC